MLFTIEENGRKTVNVDRERAEELGYSEASIYAAEASATAIMQRNNLRAGIDAAAGDIPSLLGTTADGAQLVIYHLAVLATELSTAQSLAEVRSAAAPFATLTAAFLEKIESGEIKLTALLKGEGNVIAEIESRATAVSEVLEEVSGL